MWLVGIFLILPAVTHTTLGQKLSPFFNGYTSVKIDNISVGGTKEYIDLNNVRYEVRVFRGIPYAEPPTGEKRFKPPVKKAPFKASFNATRFGDACLQRSVGINTASDILAHKRMSEDCLYLNVYAPVAGDKKAVMVYLQDGGWMRGSGMRHDGSALAAYGDVVVVTLNFRLGPFGYLSTGDANAPGNFGLMDQMLALDWVRKNIGSFGGDPDALTLFGGSTGSFDVTLHAMIQKPSNGGLPIKRIISSSGSFITPSPVVEAFTDNPLPYATTLAMRLGCNSTDNPSWNTTQSLVECLRKKPAADIVKASEFFLSDAPHYELLAWTAVKDGSLIKERPAALFSKDVEIFKSFKSVDLLVGSNSGDGDIAFEAAERKGRLPTVGIEAPDFNITKGQLKKLIQSLFKDWPNGDGIAKAAIQEFVPYGTITGRQGRNALIDLFSDKMFIMPAIATAKVHERLEPSSTTFLYYMDYIYSGWKSRFRPEKLGHRVEQLFLFGPTADDPSKLPIRFKGADLQVSLAMLTYWTNFAKYGNPNGKKTINKPSFPEWPEFNLQTQQYLNIAGNSGASENITVKDNFRAKAVAFWLEYVPYLLKQACPEMMKCSTSATCPPLMDRYVSQIRLTVGQAHDIIIAFACTLGFFAILSIITCLKYFHLRKQLAREARSVKH